jgi:hypothetical protein
MNYRVDSSEMPGSDKADHWPKDKGSAGTSSAHPEVGTLVSGVFALHDNLDDAVTLFV